jgi:membrane fusion protein, heavy metal efflux system
MGTTLELFVAARMNRGCRRSPARRWRTHLASSCALACALAPAFAAAQTMRPAKQPVACLIGPERVADIGSPVVGVVSAMNVDSGDSVSEGQTLVLLRADVESANVNAAQARAVIDADVRAAQANLELARQRHERAKELQDQGFVSSQATDQARAEHDVAAQKLEQARGQKQVAARELDIVQAQLGQRTVRSPFAGVVTDRFINAGERVEEKPMLRLAMLNPLRVELVLPASRYGTVALNDRVSVIPDLPGAAPAMARVTLVDKVIDAASNTFRVRMSLPNPGHKLPAGARCRVDLAPLVAATPSPAPSRPDAAAQPAKAVDAESAKPPGSALPPKAVQVKSVRKVTG